jgi:predicted HicB family RNase H-like nuclease
VERFVADAVGSVRNTDETRSAPLGLRIRPSLKEQLVAVATEDRRTLASYVELVLEAHVEAKKKGTKR